MSSLDGDDWGESEWWDAALSSISSDPAWWGLEGADHDSEIPTDIDALVNICVDKRLIRTEDFWWYFISMAPTEEMIKDMIESAKKHTSLSAFYEHIIDSGLVDEWKFGEVPENHLEDVIEFVSYLTKQQLGLPPTPTSAPETPPKQRLRKMSTESALSGLSWHEGETVYSDKWGESGLIFKSSDVTGSLVEQLDMSSVNIVTYIYIYIYLANIRSITVEKVQARYSYVRHTFMSLPIPNGAGFFHPIKTIGLVPFKFTGYHIFLNFIDHVLFEEHPSECV